MTDQKQENIVKALTAEEPLLLFCVASGTDLARAGITGATVRTMIIKDLINRERETTRLLLTARGRAVLQALLAPAGIRFVPLN